MPTPAEHRALLFVAALAALGVGVRGCRVMLREPIPASDRQSLAIQMAAVDSAIAAGGRRPRSGSKAPPKAPATAPSGSPAKAPSRSAAASNTDAPAARSIDVDRATAAELERLPGIGPSLAARIVADRAEHGPFGSIEGLQRVKGIGPGLSRKVQPYVTFSLPPRPSHTGTPPSGALRRP